MQGYLTPIGECFSGLLVQRRTYERYIAIATPPALQKVVNAHDLRTTVEQLPNLAESDLAIFANHGLCHQLFLGWRQNPTLGLHLDGDAADQTRFEQARALLRSMGQGVHRQILLKKMGVSADPKINDLQPGLYAALLATVKDRYQAGRFEGVSAIAVEPIPFDLIENTPEGKRLIFSQSQLERATRWATIEEC
jgi:hypothetical protein